MTLGLSLDLLGASLLAWEVFRKYKGERFELDQSPTFDTSNPPRSRRTDVYKAYENRKHARMTLGLLLLLIGIILQIIVTWETWGSTIPHN